MEYKHDTGSGVINRLRTRNNDNVLEKIAKYYNEDYPNVEDR